MSIEALTVVLHHSRAKNSAKVVLMGIANHYHPDDDRGAWPSQDLLAKYANVTDRQVRKCIEQLVALQEVRVESHGGPSKGNYKPNKYWITLECPDDCDGSMNHRKKATGTIEQDNRNYLTEQPEPEFRRTLSEPKEKPKYAKSIPDNFTPSDSIQESFEAKYGSVLSYGETLEAFTDYHLAKGSKFKDWDAAFRNWCRNAISFQKPKTVIHKQEMKPAANIPERRGWVREFHDAGDHWACKPGEFGCK